ncbi:MAG: dynamin family protein [Granulosicoccaceae bacterium]
MVRPDKSIVKRFDSLKTHLKRENPALVGVIAGFRQLDDVGYRTGLIGTDESYAMQISWWPLISVLGVFSAGKSSFINSYLGRTLQKTGNQAVDDKFTVVCYGKENAGQVLPGLAVDADMRFPFYRISDEIENVAEGEGRRIDAYLQLKVTDSEAVRGKIIVDSPGFDADDQRTSTLKLTNHIMDISDLVMVFFDARHPEPGAMQDTLRHLVQGTITRSDSNKFMFILNQIDTASREDNTEEVVGAWQRALSQKGLTAGRFYTIFNKDIAPDMSASPSLERLAAKSDADMADIEERIQQVEVERAYRIVGAMEKQAYRIRDESIPALRTLKKDWSSKVLKWDAIALGTLLAVVLGISIATGFIGSLMVMILSLFSNPVAMLSGIAGVVIPLFIGHHLIRKWVRGRMLPQIAKSDSSELAAAFIKNTSFFNSVFSSSLIGWNKGAEKKINRAIEQASEFVQKLNDQFTDPSGQ